MVNWCPASKSAISDEEVNYKTSQGTLWYFKYPIKNSNESIIVATTRPETMLGDTGVAVNPNDSRYQHLIGKKVVLPIVGREIPIFGDEYVKNGKVDRKKLGGVIFNDKDKKKKLESLLHPLIRKEIEKRAEKSEEQGVPYFIDIPLFYETNAYNIKNVLVVYATKELQLERLVKRDGFSYEDANSRIDSQISIEEKKKLATYVVDNTKDLGHLTNELENFRRKISADFKI